MRKTILALTAAFALAGGAAWAHPKLVSASPAPGATVAAPHEVRITFSEAVFPKLSAVELADHTGAVVKTGAPGVDPRDKKQLVTPIAGALATGHYVVRWRAVSSDTHRVQGTFDFTVK
jgi:methionine-rich copper-binding protein CopC